MNHQIDFVVPLSGSLLFDLNATLTAKKLCTKFPGLRYKTSDKEVHIYGELNDYWFEKWNTAVFKIGILPDD